MMSRSDFGFTLEHAKAAFDIGKGLVACDDLGRREISHVRHKPLIAIHELSQYVRFAIDLVGK